MEADFIPKTNEMETYVKLITSFGKKKIQTMLI
jgi:hypothetical protein